MDHRLVTALLCYRSRASPLHCRNLRADLHGVQRLFFCSSEFNCFHQFLSPSACSLPSCDFTTVAHLLVSIFGIVGEEGISQENSEDEAVVDGKRHATLTLYRWESWHILCNYRFKAFESTWLMTRDDWSHLPR